MDRLKAARVSLFVPLVVCLGFAAGAGNAADDGTGKHIAAVTKSSPVAKDIFGHERLPAPLAARAIGSYARGCLAGAKPLPVDGQAWQVMRLSRNRNWGTPQLLEYLEQLARDAKRFDGWPGLMVGDMSQPMGGPMLTGHDSHQIGLDADIWLKPMPARRLTLEERDTATPVSMLAPGGLTVHPSAWTAAHVKLIMRAASYPQVTRIFVHPAIKKALCDGAGIDREWLTKVRPWWGHHYHFHVRLACPPGMTSCQNQPPNLAGDGCGREIETWLKLLSEPPKPKPTTPPVQKPPLTLADLPQECSRLVGLEPNADLAR